VPVSEQKKVSPSQPVAPPALPLDAYTEFPRTAATGVLWGAVGLTAALALIAGVAPIRKVTIAEGQVSPVGALVSVGHPEGGVVSEISARVGDRVAAGDVLMTLKPVAATSDVAQAEARRLALLLARERLQSLLEGRPSNYAGAIHPETEKDYAARIAEERGLERSERTKAAASTGGMGAGIAQRRAEVATLEGELAGLSAQARISREQLAMRRTLARDGYATRESVLDAELSVEQTEARMQQVQGQIAAARSALAQASNERAAASADQTRIWSSELSRVTAELAELDAGRARLDDRVSATIVRAPVGGVIQEIKATAAGEVLAGTQPVAMIMPTNAPLIAEIRLPPEELGDVRVGREARVAVTAFDPELYGFISGRVQSISPTTFETQDGRRYYRAVISLSRTALTRKAEAHAVVPGMGVRAEIVTGDRTLLLHLMQPIQRSLERAFTQ
jgi:HlyD family secretion protein/adhesin transport system membrane fusion protein